MMAKTESGTFKLELVKPAFDVTLSVSNIEPVLAFWRANLGLVPFETMKIREGLTQHRHRVGNSVLKMNHHANPLPKDGTTGYRELMIARSGVQTPQTLVDPEGNRVTIQPAAPVAAEYLGFRLQVGDLGASRDFYGNELGLPVAQSADGTRVGLGESFLLLEQSKSAPRNPSFDGPAWRYPTIQVPDVELTHARGMARGWREGLPIKAFGTSVRFCFVRDPDGNWIEFIQRS